MKKNIKIENIQVEKIKIGDKDFKEKDDDWCKSLELKVKKEGIKRPFIVTKVGNDYLIYNSLCTFSATKKVGYKEIPCLVISNKRMNERLKMMNTFRKKYELIKV